MTDPSPSPSNASPSTAALPERLCTWCKVAMTTRLVAGGQFIHYTCPKCVFQHTTKRAAK
ncbi:MAG: hypothetical protein R3B11_04865 [Nitrospira sp.]|nr:hypothetical protein [Nitrospira sp.]MDR4475325.1 hypothetical protein [Nitrospira sp.]